MGQPQTAPTEGEMVPPMEDPNMGGEPPMEDPATMGGEPPMEDPAAMGGEPPMEDSSAMGGDDSTTSIINQLSVEDREAVRAYAESMLDKQNNNANGEELPMDNAPVMESIIVTKKQLNSIMENFKINTNNEKEKTLSLKKGKTVSNKSPFNSPNFN